MNTKTIAIPFLVASFFTMLADFSYADAEREEKIVASITRVVHPKNGIADTVSIQMTIHSPSRLGGFQFIVVTESTERAKIRAKFPTGSLQTLGLPANTLKELEAQIDAHIAVEKTLDKGIDPMVISQIFLLPSVSLLELSPKPVAFSLNIEQAEQGSAHQSTTR